MVTKKNSPTLGEALVRVAEQVTSLQREMSTNHNRLSSKIDDLKEELRGSYVRKEEFESVKMVVYGLVGTILLAVVGALLANVVVGG